MILSIILQHVNLSFEQNIATTFSLYWPNKYPKMEMHLNDLPMMLMNNSKFTLISSELFIYFYSTSTDSEADSQQPGPVDVFTMVSSLHNLLPCGSLIPSFLVLVPL